MKVGEELTYDPSEEEYAKYLGMILPRDEKFLYIAREGIIAPLPKPWEERIDDEGQIMFYNPITKIEQVEHPCDEEYKEKFEKLKSQEEQLKKGKIKISKDSNKSSKIQEPLVKPKSMIIKEDHHLKKTLTKNIDPLPSPNKKVVKTIPLLPLNKSKTIDIKSGLTPTDLKSVERKKEEELRKLLGGSNLNAISKFNPIQSNAISQLELFESKEFSQSNTFTKNASELRIMDQYGSSSLVEIQEQIISSRQNEYESELKDSAITQPTSRLQKNGLYYHFGRKMNKLNFSEIKSKFEKEFQALIESEEKKFQNQFNYMSQASVQTMLSLDSEYNFQFETDILLIQNRLNQEFSSEFASNIHNIEAIHKSFLLNLQRQSLDASFHNEYKNPEISLDKEIANLSLNIEKLEKYEKSLSTKFSSLFLKKQEYYSQVILNLKSQITKLERISFSNISEIVDKRLKIEKFRRMEGINEELELWKQDIMRSKSNALQKRNNQNKEREKEILKSHFESLITEQKSMAAEMLKDACNLENERFEQRKKV